jgi:hypothetical protein
MTTRVKWAAELNHVREVSLVGFADSLYWQNRLANENLQPTDREGRVPVMIVTAEGKFMGLRFRELSISIVLATSPDAWTLTPCWLAHAFNSNRFFAFCERVLFSAPYEHATVHLEHDFPAAVSVARHGHIVYQAAMKADASPTARVSSREGQESWAGQIILPHTGRRSDQHAKMFLARIEGETHRYPFLADEDTITIQPRSDTDVLRSLLESKFIPHEWVIRTDATHAKSKTYSRDELSQLLSGTLAGEQSHALDPAAGWHSTP